MTPNDDVIAGYEFFATLQLRVPLSVLNHVGEVLQGPSEKLPRYGDQSEGIWLPKTKSWTELGIDIPDASNESEVASDIGPVKSSLYLPFLKAFRAIVEDETLSVQEQRERIVGLSEKNDSFAIIYDRLLRSHEDFPDSFFYWDLATVPGVGRKTAKALYVAGFKSIRELCEAAPEKLLEISGVTTRTVQKLQDYCAERK